MRGHIRGRGGGRSDMRRARIDRAGLEHTERAHGDEATTADGATNVPTAYRHCYKKALTYPPTRPPTFTAVSALDR